MNNSDPAIDEQRPRALEPLRWREHSTCRRPIEALRKTFYAVTLQSSPHHTPAYPEFRHHEFEKSSTTLSRLDQDRLHWQTSRNDEPRKPSPGTHIDPSSAATSQTLRQRDHLKPLCDVLRQRREILCATQVNGTPKPQPLTCKSLQLIPGHLAPHPNRRNMRLQQVS